MTPGLKEVSRASAGHKESHWERKLQTPLLSAQKRCLCHPGLAWYVGQWRQEQPDLYKPDLQFCALKARQRRVLNFLCRNSHLPPWLEANASASHWSEDQPSATIWTGSA